MATSIFPPSSYNQNLNTTDAVEFESLTIDDGPLMLGAIDDANDSEEMLVLKPTSGASETDKSSLVAASAYTDGSHWTGVALTAEATDMYLRAQVDGSKSNTSLTISAGSVGLFLSPSGPISFGGSSQQLTSDLVASNGVAIKTDTTTAHTALIQAYDVDGAAYKTFVTLTNANVPTCNISQPAGAILAFVPPTADPHVVGALWNNAGTLTISAG